MSNFNPTTSKIIPNISYIIIPMKRQGFSDWKKKKKKQD